MWLSQQPDHLLLPIPPRSDAGLRPLPHPGHKPLASCREVLVLGTHCPGQLPLPGADRPARHRDDKRRLGGTMPEDQRQVVPLTERSPLTEGAPVALSDQVRWRPRTQRERR